MLRITSILLLVVVVTAESGCGGSGSGGQTNQDGSNSGDNATTVVVTPGAIGQVWQGTTVAFQAQVTGQSNLAVVWSVREGSAGGSIDGTGLYTAPHAAGTFHVVATSQADPTARGVASVDVPPVTVLISPPTEVLRIGGQRQFGGFAVAADQNVTWKILEGQAGGNITTGGFYTAPSVTGTFHVTATSLFDPSISTTAPVTIVTTGFTPISDMEVTRFEHTATSLVDGRVLVAGGTSDPTRSAELFTPLVSSFSPISMIQVRAGHCAALLMSGEVLIAGGHDANGSPLKTAELFDPATQNFTATGDLNQARTGATATLLPTGKVLIAGGQDGSGALLFTAEVYDPISGTFSVTGNMNIPRAQHTATFLSSGRVLLVGSTTATAKTELFDPVSGLFTPTGSLINARAHHTSTLVLGGKILVLGGDAGGISLDSIEIYDPASGTFNSAGKLGVPRASHSATLVPSGMILVAGGYSRGFDGDAQPFFNTMFAAELINPNTFASTVAASLEGSRAEHVAAILNNGQVLVTGGRSGSGSSLHTFLASVASAELYK